LGHDHPHKHSVRVSAIIFNDHGEVLITKRRDTGAWVPPGGILHLHEPIEDGLRREVHEETGLEIEVERLTGVYKNTATGVLSLVFRCRPASPSSIAQNTSEVSQLRWISARAAEHSLSKPYAMRVNAHRSRSRASVMSSSPI
jgi:8-oxo-dGTP pyrophosphatase MutT (NUDIX family)